MPKNHSIVSQLFQNAEEEGTISQASLNTLNIVDLGQQIQAGLGVSVDDVPASEVILVTSLLDDSSSIRSAGKEQAVREGENIVLDALKQSKQSGNVLVNTSYLNGTILHPYVSLDQALYLDSQNYEANGGTPLYDQTVLTLGTVLAKAQEFSDNGVLARTITLIVTDGEDQHSIHQSARTVEVLINDLLKTETHIIAAMGIDNGHTDFYQIFKEMGIRDDWILTPGNNESEIRKAFQVFSQSALKASQNAASFSQQSMGGFLA